MDILDRFRLAKKKAQELAASIHWIEGNLSFLSSNLSHDRGWNAASDLTKAIQKATALKKEIRDGLSVTGLNLQWGTPEDLIGQLNTLIAETEKRQLQTSQSLKRLGERLAHGVISHKLKRVREELNALKEDAAQELLSASPSSSPLPGPVQVEDWLEWFWDRDDDADQILENLEGDYPNLAVFLQAVSPEQWQSFDSPGEAHGKSVPHEGRSGKAPHLHDETGRTWASGSGDPDLDSAWSQLCATDWIGLGGPTPQGQGPQKEALPPAKNSTSTSDIHWDTVSWIPTGPVDPFSVVPPLKPESPASSGADLPVELGVKPSQETRPEAFPTVPLFGEGATPVPTMGPFSPVAQSPWIPSVPVAPPVNWKPVGVPGEDDSGNGAPPRDVPQKDLVSKGEENPPGGNSGWTSFQEALLRGVELPPDQAPKGETRPVAPEGVGKGPINKGPDVWGQPRSDRKENPPKNPIGNGPSGIEEMVPPTVAVGAKDPWGLPSAKKGVGQPGLSPVEEPQGLQPESQAKKTPIKTGPTSLPEQIPSGHEAPWGGTSPGKPVSDPFAPISSETVPAQQKLDPWSVPVTPRPQDVPPGKSESLEHGASPAGGPPAPKADDPWKAAARSKDTPFGGVKAWGEGTTAKETPNQPKGGDPWGGAPRPKDTPLVEGKPTPESTSKKDIPGSPKANDPWSAPVHPKGPVSDPVKPAAVSGPAKEAGVPPKATDPWGAPARLKEAPIESGKPPGGVMPAKEAVSPPKAIDPWSVPARPKDTPVEQGKVPAGNVPENATSSPKGADPRAVPGRPKDAPAKDAPIGQAKGPVPNVPVPPKGVDPWASIPSKPLDSNSPQVKGPVPAVDPWAKPVSKPHSEGAGGPATNSPASGDPNGPARKPSWGRPKKPVAIDPSLAEPVKGEAGGSVSVPQPPLAQWGQGKTPDPIPANPSPSPASASGGSAGHPGGAHPGSPVHWGNSQPVQNQPLLNDALKSIGAPSPSETEALLRGTAPVTSDLEALLRGTAPRVAEPSPSEARPNPAPNPGPGPGSSAPAKTAGGGGIVWEKPPQEKAFQGGWGKGPMDSLAHPSTAPKNGPATQAKMDPSQGYGGAPSGPENRPYSNGSGSPFNGNGNGKSLFAEPPRPATRMRETASRSSSQGGSIFEAASSRRMIRNDPWLRSPLNTDQEAILTDLSNGVVVVFGSRLSGLDKLMDGIREIPNLTGVIAAGPMTESHQFEAWLTEVNNSLANMPNGTALAVVDSSIRWSVQWIRFASNLLRSRNDHERFLRVVFVADPSHDWTWTGDEERRQLGAFELTLRQ